MVGGYPSQRSAPAKVWHFSLTFAGDFLCIVSKIIFAVGFEYYLDRWATLAELSAVAVAPPAVAGKTVTWFGYARGGVFAAFFGVELAAVFIWPKYDVSKYSKTAGYI